MKTARKTNARELKATRPHGRPAVPDRHAERPTLPACFEYGCSNLGIVAGYCRAHYIKNWASIKRKQEILRAGTLQKYIEELVAKYPPSVIHALRTDLADEEAFERAISDLEFLEETEETVGLDTSQIDESPLVDTPPSDPD